mmetsp:Transcript_24390/g.27125  ORF Transcript_24390/g.27125 Transcript_24390/m.27125 type:complete len:85 (+) Transcript_24390:62-316(+)
MPKPEELRPFPEKERIRYIGHEGGVRSISVYPSGQWMLSGSDDKTVRLWEVQTGRCQNKWQFDSIIHQVSWNPNPDYCCFCVVT